MLVVIAAGADASEETVWEMPAEGISGREEDASSSSGEEEEEEEEEEDDDDDEGSPVGLLLLLLGDCLDLFSATTAPIAAVRLASLC